MSKIYLIAACSFLVSCQKLAKSTMPFSKIETEILLEDTFSIRAISLEHDKIWYAADHGKMGCYDLKTGKKFQKIISYDSKAPEFRSIAQNKDHIFLLSIGSPALLYKISKKSLEVKLVYQDDDSRAFYDSMQFFNNKEGIALGDPIDGCFSVLTTEDSGETWQKMSCDKLPQALAGEGAFAASNTNIIVNENATWMVSGGKSARVFFSSDKGKSWQAYPTPIIQGEEMTGIFSAAFYDNNIGFAVGGNYSNPGNNSKNKALTLDGGRTWEIKSDKKAFGYASCVQFVPKSLGQQLVTVGPSGIFYSADQGKSWKQLSKEKDFHTIRFLDKTTAIAAGKNKVVKIFFKN